jgi:hypothetical protein
MGTSTVHGAGPGHTNSFNHDENPDGPHGATSHQYKTVDHFDLTDDGVQRVIGAWYSMDDAHRQSLMKKMWYLGLTKSADDFDGAFSVWKQAVSHAANFTQAGRPMDPQDVLGMMADGSQGPGAKAKGGPRSSRQIDFTDPATAKAWVTTAFQQSMGRDPNDAEIRAMTDSLHKAQQMTPQVTTTTPTKFDAEGNVIDSTTTTTGGVDPQAFFQNQMNADPEAGAHQAAAQLLPALMQALGSGVPGADH